MAGPASVARRTRSSLGWIKRPHHAVFAVLGGVAVWYIAVRRVDDYWLFWPWTKLLGFLDG